MKTAMFLLGLVLLASTVEHATAFGHIAQAIEETHAAIEQHIASKHMKKVAVSGPREVAVSGPRAAVSGPREVKQETKMHPLHNLIPDLGLGHHSASASASADTGY